MLKKMGKTVTINMLIILLLTTNIVQPQTKAEDIQSIIDESLLDVQYIYNLTENLCVDPSKSS